jgi:hypothetical protein
MASPYAHHVDRDPVDVLASSLDDYCVVVERLTADDWRRPWQPGKWTVAQIMVHVAQWEMILGIRVRCAVAAPDYAVQPMDQDELMRVEGDVVDGDTAFAAFEGARRMNLALAASLSPGDRRKRCRHPEQGDIDVEYLLVTMAGHGVHHFKQIVSVT